MRAGVFRHFIAAVSAFACLSISIAKAGTSTGSLSIQTTITAACTIGASTVNFGTLLGINLLASLADTTATVSVTCTNGSPYSIGLDNGANASGSQRRMVNGGNYINYGLYLDVLRLSPWTTAANASTCSSANSCYLGTGNGSAQSITIYGRIPLLAVAPAAAAYSDTVTMTITY